MIDILTAASGSMEHTVQRLRAISHNIANASTVGFKKEISVARSFDDALTGAVMEQARVDVITDFSMGALKFTGNALDLSLDAGLFLEVATERGPAYTRQGNLHLDPDGRLVTAGGVPVTGAGGEIRLATTSPVIDQSGRVWEGEKMIDQIRLVNVSNPDTLARLSAGLYQPSPGTIVSPEPANARVHQGYLEAANVVLMDEMVQMIETMRQFESSHRLIQGYDDMLDKAVNVVGDL